MYDILVLGGGPAGATAAIYGARAGLNIGLVYRDGGALARAEKIENFYGAGPLSGPELFRKGLSQAESFGVELLNREVLGLGYGMAGFEAYTKEETLEAKAIVLAMGTSRKKIHIPLLEELEGKGVSYCAVCDGFFCRGREVAVLGAGDYALHEAGVLLPLASKVTLLTNGEPVPALPQGLFADDRKVEALEGEGTLTGVRFADGQVLSVPRLFVALGTAGSGDLAKKVGIVTDGAAIRVNGKMETNVPGLFAAGDCTGGLLQVAKAAAEGAQAGLSAVQYVKKS